MQKDMEARHRQVQFAAAAAAQQHFNNRPSTGRNFDEYNATVDKYLEWKAGYNKNQRILHELPEDAAYGTNWDYAKGIGKGWANESWQAVQFLGKSAAYIGSYTSPTGMFMDRSSLNPFNPDGYHSLIGEGGIWGAPTTLSAAYGMDLGEGVAMIADATAAVPLIAKARHLGKLGRVEETVETFRDSNGVLRTLDGRFAADDTIARSQLHRPSLRSETKKTIEANARKNSQGQYVDHNGEVITDFHYGHISGHENRRILSAADELRLSQSQLNDYVNARPQFFQIEDATRNFSHAGEMLSNGKIDHIIADMEAFFGT